MTGYLKLIIRNIEPFKLSILYDIIIFELRFPIIFNYLSNNILFHGAFLYFLSALRQIKKVDNYDNNKPIGLAYIIISTSSGYKNILMNIEFYLSFHLFNPLFFSIC